MSDIEAICRLYGLTRDELAELLSDTDRSRGLLTPQDLELGLKSVLAVYVGALSSTAERIVDPSERLIVDRFLSVAMETLAGQLEGAPEIRN